MWGLGALLALLRTTLPGNVGNACVFIFVPKRSTPRVDDLSDLWTAKSFSSSLAVARACAGAAQSTCSTNVLPRTGFTGPTRPHELGHTKDQKDQERMTCLP